MSKTGRVAEKVGGNAVVGKLSIPISKNAVFAYSIIEKIMYVGEGNTVIAYNHSGKETARHEYNNIEITKLYPSNGFVKIVYCYTDNKQNKEWYQGKVTPICSIEDLLALHRTDKDGIIIDFVDKETDEKPSDYIAPEKVNAEEKEQEQNNAVLSEPLNDEGVVTNEKNAEKSEHSGEEPLPSVATPEESQSGTSDDDEEYEDDDDEEDDSEYEYH